MFKVLDLKTNEQRVMIDYATRDEMEAAFRGPAREGQLGCPHCRERVIFRNGEVYVPHFAHKAVGPCPYSSDSLEILKARAALYRFLKSQPGLIVNIEHPLAAEKLKRPIDCWVKCGDKTFAYWLMEKGVRGQEKVNQLKDAIRKAGAKGQFIFLAQMIQKVPDEWNTYRISATEEQFFRRSPYDLIYSSGAESSLSYIDAEVETAEFITMRSLSSLFCGRHFRVGEFLRHPLSLMRVAPLTGELAHPGESEQLSRYAAEAVPRKKVVLPRRVLMPRTPAVPPPPVRIPPPLPTASTEAMSPIRLRPTQELPQPQEPVQESVLKALAMQKQNGVVYHPDGEIEAACESCGAFTTDWMSYDGSKGLCKCNDCFQPGRKRAMEKYAKEEEPISMPAKRASARHARPAILKTVPVSPPPQRTFSTETDSLPF